MLVVEAVVIFDRLEIYNVWLSGVEDRSHLVEVIQGPVCVQSDSSTSRLVAKTVEKKVTLDVIVCDHDEVYHSIFQEDYIEVYGRFPLGLKGKYGSKYGTWRMFQLIGE